MVKFFIETYGCQMNVSESDSLRSALQTRGHICVEKPPDADAVIINTCSVRKTAEQRIKGRLGYYRGQYGQTGKKIHVILMGCMAQNIGPEMKRDFPDVVSLVWGTYNKDGILDFFDHLDGLKDFLKLDEYRFMDARPNEKYSFRSFVPISHGCDNYCSYCIVPYVRGPEIHRKSEEIIDNVNRLRDQGVLEITLLGQNVNSYRDGSIGFSALLDRIAVRTGIPRLSFMTSHPKDFSRDLATVIAAHSNILKGIHLPAQSGSNDILKRMNRKYTAEEYLEKVSWALSIPDAALTTDLIVGYPGETEADFQKTIELVKTVRFNEAFTYHYNTRPGTTAALETDHVPESEKKRRLAELIELQISIKTQRLQEWQGKSVSALMESISKKKNNELSGRTHSTIAIHILGNKNLIGTIVSAEIIGYSGSGLTGRLTAGGHG